MEEEVKMPPQFGTFKQAVREHHNPTRSKESLTGQQDNINIIVWLIRDALRTLSITMNEGVQQNKFLASCSDQELVLLDVLGRKAPLFILLPLLYPPIAPLALRRSEVRFAPANSPSS